MALMTFSTGLSVEKSISGAKIFSLKKQLGEEDLLKVLIFVIKNFCDSLNVKESMNPLQIVEAAGEVMEKFTHESIDDFILCLKKGKNGEYGPIYNKIDRSVLFTFWAKYLEEKSLFLENKNLNYKALESNQFLGFDQDMPEKIREQFSKMLENIQRNSYKRKIREKTSFNSLEAFLEELKEWLPGAKSEEVEMLKKDATSKGSSAVLEMISSYQQNPWTRKEQENV